MVIGILAISLLLPYLGNEVFGAVVGMQYCVSIKY